MSKRDDSDERLKKVSEPCEKWTIKCKDARRAKSSYISV